MMVNHVSRRHSPPQHLFECTADLEPYSCKDCDIEFEAIIELKKHISEQHEVKCPFKYSLKIYACKRCPFESRSLLQWYRHGKCVKVKKEKSKNQFPDECVLTILKCADCEYITITEQDLLEHYNKNHPENDHKSEVNCVRDEEVMMKDELENFERRFKYVLTQHSDYKKWFYCNMCSFKTIWKYYLAKHSKLKHSNIKKTWFKCEKCPFKTSYAKYLVVHNQLKHTDGEQKYWLQCEKCGYKTTQKGYFNRHWLVHHAENRNYFKCKTCTFKTMYKQSLRQHIATKHIY